jgi:actin-like ATPase involved in cell morphogenesis
VVGQASSISSRLYSKFRDRIIWFDIRTISIIGCSFESRRKAGVALIDIGGGTTDLAIFKMELFVIPRNSFWRERDF